VLAELNSAFAITGPILLLLLIGWSTRQWGWINDAFVTQANALVFNIAMPVMLFLAISQRSFDQSVDLTMMLVGLVGTFLLVALLLLVGRLIPRDQRGVFVQGSYRGNLAILGLALSVATYGDDVMPLVAVYIGVVTTAYNVMAVWLLNSSDVLGKLLRNPILIGILAGTLASLLDISLPTFLVTTGEYLSDLTLPLALLCIGGTLDFGSLRTHGRSIGLAVLFKLLISPLLLLSLGIASGLEQESLGVLFFMAASPTATASYIMARQMTAHGALAGEIVAVTTALGIVTYTIGLAGLRMLGMA